MPGDVVTYTLSFQLSEYIGIQALSVTDIIPDGIDYNVDSATVTVPGLGSAPIVAGAAPTRNAVRQALVRRTATLWVHVVGRPLTRPALL